MIPLVDLTRPHAALRPALLAAVARVLDSSRFILGGEGQAFYTVRHPQRDAFAKALADLGVGTAIHYPIPVPARPLFGARDERAWPEAWRAAREVVSLPCFAELTDAEVEEVAQAVRLACGRL